MQAAHHIIGFRGLELGKLTFDPSSLAEIIPEVRSRFEEIKAAGCIQARRFIQDDHWDRVGRSHWEDDLAGDDRYVFLSVGPRYNDQAPREATFGFVFEAEILIEAGAILGLHDLAGDYTEIVGEAAEEVAATLPRLERISQAELDEFAAAMGVNDPAMLEFISDNSTNPESELLEALSQGNEAYPGYQTCLALIKERIQSLHQAKRFSGQAALHHLSQGPVDGRMEILVPNSLDLSLAVGFIE